MENRSNTALREFCLEASEIGVQDLVDEFLEGKRISQCMPTSKTTAFDANKSKNRAKAYCLDNHRIILSYPPGSNDYIHANWVGQSEKEKRFICTQGPLKCTINDFWRMVWQEKCRSIVMLCDLIERGHNKCDQYWPNEGEEMKLLSLTVKSMSVKEIEPKLQMSKIEIQEPNEAKDVLQVDHYFWRGWPDRSVPSDSLALLRIFDRIEKMTPTVVHCSAGVGRTGTFVAIDLIYNRLVKGEKVDVKKTLQELRAVRYGSVQTESQYLYLYRSIMDFAVDKKVIAKSEIQSFLDDYDEVLRIEAISRNQPSTNRS